MLTDLLGHFLLIFGTHFWLFILFGKIDVNQRGYFRFSCLFLLAIEDPQFFVEVNHWQKYISEFTGMRKVNDTAVGQ
jgi:hypothetical protein